MHDLKKELYALIKNDERILDFIQEGPLDGLWYLDLERPGNGWMNARFWKLLGYNAEAMPDLASAWQNIVNPDDLQAAIDSLHQHLENPDHPYEPQVRCTHKDGSTAWIRCRGMAIRDDSGRPVRLLGVHQNMTELMPVEKKLQKSEYLFRAIFEQSVIGMARVMPDGRFMQVNQKFSEITGYATDELLSMNWTKIIHAEDLPEHYYEKVLNDELGVLSVETQCFHKDGNVVWVDMSVSMIRGGEGRTRDVIVNIVDITERKIAEGKYTMLKQAIDHSQNAVNVLDHNGQFVYVNQAYVEMWGYNSAKEIIGTSPSSHWASPNQSEEIIRELQRHGQHVLEREARRKDGSIFDVLMYTRLDYALDGNVIYTATSLDITEQKQAEERLKISEARYRTLVDTIHSGVTIYKVINEGQSGSDYIIQDFNQYALKHEKMQKEAVLGKSLKEIRPNIDEYGLIDIFQKVWKTGESAFFPAKIYVDEKYSNYYENRIFRLPSGEVVAIYDDVSDRENATELMKESQERFGLAMKASADGLFDWNLETNEIYYSPGWKRMLGYRDDELPNDFSVWERLTQKSDVEKSWNMQQALIEKKRDRFELEFKMKHRDGHWVDILSRAEAVFDENGNAVRIVGTHVDITDRKQAEEALKKSEERFRSYVEHAPDGIFVTDENGQYLEVNPAGCSLTGYSSEELLSKSIPDLLQNEEIERGLDQLREVQKKGAARGVLGYIAKGGDNRYWEVAAVKLSDGRILEFVKDITEQKKAEALLQVSERRMNTLMNNLSGMAYRCLNLPRWTMLFVSSGCEALTGYRAQDLVNDKTVSYLDIIHPEDRKSVWASIQDIVWQHQHFELEYRIINKIGEEKWVWERGVCAGNDEDGHQILEGFITDITDRKLAEERLKISDQRYRRAQEIGHVANWEYNLQTTDFWGSDEAKRIYGFSMDDANFAIDDVENCILERERVHQGLIDLIEHGKPYHLEFDIITHNGKERKTILSIAELERDNNGKPLKVTGVIQNITERKKVEDELKRSEKKYRILFEYSPIMLGILDATGAYQEVNATVPKMLGYSDRDLKGKDSFGFIHKDDLKIVIDLFSKVVETGEGEGLYRFKHKNGDYRIIQSRAARIPDTDNYILFSDDITEKKVAEEALLNSQNRYQSLFENSPVPLWEEDFSAVMKQIALLKKRSVKDFRAYFSENPQMVRECAQLIKIIDVNNSVLKLHDATSKDELLEGLPKIFTDQSYDAFFQELMAIAEGRTECEFGGTVKTLQGQVKAVHVKWMVVPGYEETLEKVYLSTTDITQRKTAEQELRKQRDLFELVINSVPTRISWKNLHSVYLGCNLHFARDAGMEKVEDVIGNSDDRLIWKRDAEKYRLNDQMIMQSGEAKLNYEETFINRDNEKVVWRTRKMPLKNAQSEIIGIVAASENITDEKMVADQLKASEEKYRVLAENARHLIITHDFEGKITYANAFAQQYINLPQEQIVGLNINHFISGRSEIEELKQRVHDFKSNKSDVHLYELGIALPSGEQRMLEVYGNPIKRSGKNDSVLIVAYDITERRRSENKIRESEEKLRLAIDNSPLGICTNDMQGNFLSTNQAYEKMVGYSKEELSVMSFFDLTYSEDHSQNRNLFNEMAADMTAGFNMEKRYVRKDGGIINVLVHAGAIHDAQGKPMVGLAFVEDITERISKTETLKAREREFRILFDDSPAAVYETDAKGLCIKVNKKWQEISGLTLDEAKGEGWINGIVPEDRQKIQDDWFEYALTSGEWSSEYRFCDKKGKITWVWGMAKALYDDDGVITGYVGTNLDITQLKEAKQALIRNEEKYRLLAENSTDAIWTMDLRLNFTYISSAIYQLTGFTQDEWIGTNLSAHATRKEFFNMARQALTAAKNYRKFDYSVFESQLLKKNGEAVSVEIIGKLQLSEKGMPVGFQGTTRNIEDRKKAQKEIEKYQHELEGLVQERTAELEEKNTFLERMNDAMVDREFRIKELRDELADMRKKGH